MTFVLLLLDVETSVDSNCIFSQFTESSENYTVIFSDTDLGEGMGRFMQNYTNRLFGTLQTFPIKRVDNTGHCLT